MDSIGGRREEEAETLDPRSCSNSNQASMDGTDDGREEEVGTPNPHTYSSSNRASIALAAIEQVWMVPAMGNLNPHMRDTWHRMKVPVLHQKSDATSTCFGFWLKEEETPFLSYRGEEISLALVSLALTGPF